MPTVSVPLARYLTRSLLALAGVVLAIALIAICVHTRSAWPWLLIVHEDGQRSLIGTILYFEHATRELPLDILLGVTIGGCVFFAFPPDREGLASRGSHRVLALAIATAVIIAIIVIGAAIYAGPPSVIENLLQNHTRFGAALLWGSHWRYHLLERIALMLIVIGFAGMLRFFIDGGLGREGRPGLTIAAATIGVYFAFTIVFANGLLSMLQPFRDPQYLGHQIRELMTHALVTVPVGWAGCMLLLPKAELGAPMRSLSWPKSVSPIVVITLLLGVVGMLLGLYVVVAALKADAASYGQTKDIVTLIFPHFFEHSFTYLVVPTVAALVYEMEARRSAVQAAGSARTIRGARIAP